MATPFENWFSADFNRLINSVKPEVGVFSNTIDIRFASWDRRAAYLLWDALGRPNAGWVDQTASLYRKARDPLDDLLGESPPPSARTTPDDLDDIFG